MSFGGSPKCPQCGKSVYANESVLGPGGNKYHKRCFRCEECNRSLDSTTLSELKGDGGVMHILCKSCYAKVAGPAGYGYGGGAGVLATDRGAGRERLAAKPAPPVAEEKREEVPYVPKPAPRPAVRPSGGVASRFGGGAPRCPRCGKYVLSVTMWNLGCRSVYHNEKAPGKPNYHRACFNCISCRKMLDSTTASEHANEDGTVDVLCRGCYARLHGPKGCGFGGMAHTQ